MDNLSDYDYELPAELIAKEPPQRRDASRLLVVNRQSGNLRHQTISELPSLLRPSDCLVLNDTQVLPARLLGRRAATGGKWEGLFLRATGRGHWMLIGQTRGRLLPGEQLVILPAHDPEAGEELRLTLLEQDQDGQWSARPESDENELALLQRFGTVPLPPYLGREVAREEDWERYQTTYARRPGAIAAPTAGLHLTPELLTECENVGISQVFVTLHVGIGTFRPISVSKLSDHQMHAEWCELTSDAAETLHETKRRGGRIIAVGTTSVRTLESACCDGRLKAHRGETNLFIRPPYLFQAVDGLLTNFHLPKSTLFVLVCAFAGAQAVKQAYEIAIRERYRFYSYGDAMLIL